MKKRKVSIFIPYYSENNTICVFLQKRSTTAKILPGYFGFFGGGIEKNESSREALDREIQEELSSGTNGAELFSRYEFYGSIKYIYTMVVKKDFEDQIVIGEGDYGKFFKEEDITNEKLIIEEDLLVLKNFFGKMKRDDPFGLLKNREVNNLNQK